MPSSTAPTSHRGQSLPIDLLGKIAQIDGHWQPRVVAEMNDYQFKVVKLLGDFVWHAHADTDETFIVLDGELHIEMRGEPEGERTIRIAAGEMAVVPRGVEHRPRAPREVKLLLIEPRGVRNTGDGETSDLTVANDQWI